MCDYFIELDRLNLIYMNYKVSSGIINGLFSIFLDEWWLIIIFFSQIGETSWRMKNIGDKQCQEGETNENFQIWWCSQHREKALIQERKISLEDQ